MAKFGISKGHKYKNLVFEKDVSDKVRYFLKFDIFYVMRVIFGSARSE